MSAPEIRGWLSGQQDAMAAMPRDMVEIDSGSYNKPGIDAVGGKAHTEDEFEFALHAAVV